MKETIKTLTKGICKIKIKRKSSVNVTREGEGTPGYFIFHHV